MSTTRDRITDAALEQIEALSFEDLLAALSPERIADGKEFSAGTVRYQFRDGQSLSFDRRQLVLGLLDRFIERALAEAARSVPGYIAAAEALGREGDLDAVEAAIQANLDSFAPGSAGSEATAGERLHLLALAISDNDPAVAGRLRQMQRSVQATFVPVYEAFLAATGRRMASGYAVSDLATVVNALLEGLLLVHRYDTSTNPRSIVRAALQVFWGLTVPTGEDHDPATE